VVVHGIGNLDETSNVSTLDQRRKRITLLRRVLNSSGNGGVENVDHDLLEALVNLLGGPVTTLRVLGHLKTRDSDTTSVGSLTRGVPDTLGVLKTLSLEDINSLLSGTHVRTLGNELGAVGNKSLSLLTGDLVLGSTRKSNISLDVDPRASTLEVLELGGELVSKSRKLSVGDLDVSNLSNLSGGETLGSGGNESTLGVGKRDNGTTELNDLESSVLSDVTGTRDGDGLASEGLLALSGVLNHLLDVVNDTVTSGLRTDQRTTPGETLTSEDTLPGVLESLVGTEKVTNFSATDVNVTSGNIGISTNVSVELTHEGNTESADLGVGLALGVEVGTTLTTTHVQASKSVLEDLLITKELEDRKVDTGVESKTTLVRTESRVELDSVTTVDLGNTVVVFPDNTELEDTLGDRDDRDNLLKLRALLEKSRVLKSGQKLVVGLFEFGLGRLDHFDVLIRYARYKES